MWSTPYCRITSLACAAIMALALAVSLPAEPLAQDDRPGILLLAHGGRPSWNEQVTQLASRLDAQVPIEVAFGMASRAAIQSALDRLVARRVTRVVAVPLFISSHSSVITSTAYLLGLRAEAPPDLAAFARMSHGAGGHGHAGHDAPAADGTTPVTAPVPVKMTAALDSHEIVGAILIDRARRLSTNAAAESVVLVAHGPVPEADNRRWLAGMAVLAERVRTSAPFASVDYLTVRDDAGPEIRDVATAELRALVTKRQSEGRRVLLVPLLLAYGGIEQGIRKRLEGLDYAMAEQALMPDDRIGDWVLQSAGVPRP
jgi:sirohydrochlorin ferrochelatase